MMVYSTGFFNDHLLGDASPRLKAEWLKGEKSTLYAYRASEWWVWVPDSEVTAYRSMGHDVRQVVLK